MKDKQNKKVIEMDEMSCYNVNILLQILPREWKRTRSSISWIDARKGVRAVRSLTSPYIRNSLIPVIKLYSENGLALTSSSTITIAAIQAKRNYISTTRVTFKKKSVVNYCRFVLTRFWRWLEADEILHK